MKIQDIKKDSQLTEVTFSTFTVKAVAGYQSAFNSYERNVTKSVRSIKEDTIFQNNGTVEVFRKFIELEDGYIIGMFWSRNSGSSEFRASRYAKNVYRDAI